MRFKAVIFDLDGTLLDTIEDLTDSMNAALAGLGFPGRSIEECKQLVGDGLATFVERVLPPKARDNPAIAARLAERMRTEYKRRSAVKTKPYEGIAELLNALTEQAMAMAVLSNKPHDSTVEIVKKYFPRWTFRAIFGARDGVPIKPDPAPALEIARILDLAPAQILYLGDTNTDMWTADAAGMFAVGALWGFRTARELKAAGAKILIEKPMDLLSLLT
jgi:phosphoglycolate phosphatase